MKEYVKTKDGKRKLYLSYLSLDLQNFITYTLDQNTTCDIIYENNKNLIESKLTELYKGSNIDFTNFDFFLIDLKEIKKTPGYFVSKIKLNRNILIFNFLQNPKTILCFMPNNKIVQDKQFKRNEEKYQINNDKLLEMKKNYLNGKQVGKIINNEQLFLYDYVTKIYTKTKGSLSEKEFTIHGKTDIIIHIQDILTITYCDINHPFIDILTVESEYKPPFYIFMKTEENQWVIGFKNEEKLKKWKNGFDFTFINLRFFMNDINFNIELNDLKNSIAKKESKVINDPIKINDLAEDKYKKIILYKYIKDKKVLKLVEDILIYKKMILSEDNENSINKFNEIIENNKKENQNPNSLIGKIMTNERITTFIDISNKLNEISKGENKEEIKNILKIDLFDSIFDEINKMCIDPLLNKLNNEISLYDNNNESHAKRYMEGIISSNCLYNYKMEKMDSLLEL